MTGRKTLAEIRNELEAVMDRIPADAGQVSQALREFLADKPATSATSPKVRRRPSSSRKNGNAEPGSAPDRRKAGG